MFQHTGPPEVRPSNRPNWWYSVPSSHIIVWSHYTCRFVLANNALRLMVNAVIFVVIW